MQGRTEVRAGRQAVLLLIAAMASTACAGAQISLSSAVDLALRNDPRVKIAEADVAKAKASLAEARDAYIPTASATGGVGDSVGVPLSVPVIFSLSSQSLIFNFSQHDYVRAAAAGMKAAMLSLQEIRQQTTEDVATTYLSLDTAERRQAAMAEEYGYANRLVAIVQERLDAGQDTRMELLKAKKSAAQIHVAKLRVDDEVAIQADHLARLMGLPGTPLSAVATSIPPLPDLHQITMNSQDSYGIQAALATAQSKLHTSFGESRYHYRPQVSFGANYSRISTDFTNYNLYYPGFNNNLSSNAISVGIQIQVPLFDRAHQARAREAAADATHARFEAESQRNQFLEGRFKLQHSAEELLARSELAGLDRDLAQEQLNAVLAQLTADNANTGAPQLTPKDEQSARLQERQRYVDLLEAQYQLRQAEVSLLRQSGQLDAWLHQAVPAPAADLSTPAKP